MRRVGLDVGSRAIKLVELEQTSAGLRLLKTLVQDLPRSPAGHTVDRVGWLQSALKEFPSKELAVSVGGPEVAIRRVHLPLMSARELPEAVKWQVKEQVPFPIQETRLDFEVIGEVWDKDIKKQDVLVAVAASPFIQDFLALLERAGAKVGSLTPSQSALWRCVTALVPEARQGSVAVIEIGALETEVTIGKDGHIRLVREFTIGSESFTEALVGVVAAEEREVTIDHSKAEALKRRYGVIADGTEGATDEGVPLSHLSSLMRPVLEGLVTELSRVLDFYKLQVDEAGVTRVLVCGGGASLQHLHAYLAEGLGVTVEVLNPLVRIPDRVQALEPEQIAELGPRLAVAVGAALDHGEGLNVLPAEAKPSGAGVAMTPRAMRMVAIGLGALLLAGYLGLQVAAGALAWKIQRARARWAAMEPVYAETMRLTSETKALKGVVERVDRFNAQQPLWDGLLKELSELILATIALDSLSVTPDEARPGVMTVNLKGRAVSKAGEGSLASFVQAMEQSLFFTKVELVNSEMRTGEAGGLTFEITGMLE